MKFHKGDTVRHIKSKHKYAIMGTPDRYRLESTNTPAYAYTDGNEMWVRCQEEMEDGRFELVKRHNAYWVDKCPDNPAPETVSKPSSSKR